MQYTRFVYFFIAYYVIPIQLFSYFAIIMFTVIIKKKTKILILQKLRSFGCDRTTVNTKPKRTVIRHTKKHFQRALQWRIYLLHTNGLSLRHLVTYLYWWKNRWSSWIYPLLVWSSWEIIVDRDELSTDQKYLKEICNVVSKGACSPSLAQRNTGRLAHSRLVTITNHMLRFYISTKEHLDSLTCIIDYGLYQESSYSCLVSNQENSSATQEPNIFFKLYPIEVIECHA